MSNGADAWLADAPTRWPFDAMLAWCEDNNSRPATRELERWYYVEAVDLPTGRQNEIRVIEGVDATAARKVIRGEFQPYAGWDEKRTQGYVSWLRGHIRRGMTSERYGSLTQGGLL